MYLHQRLTAALFAALTLCGLAACGTVPSLRPAEVAAIRSGEQSAIVMSYRTYGSMSQAWVRFEEVTTGETYLLSMPDGDTLTNPASGIVVVPPGRYRVQQGGLKNYGSLALLPLLSYWFDPFEIGGGEVVDVGTLRVHDIDVRATATLGDQMRVWLREVRLAGRLTYLAYSIDYSAEEQVRQLLDTADPDLAAMPVRRPLPILLDAAQFEQTILEAYALNPDGTRPTLDQAESRVTAGLTRLIRESRERTEVER